MSKQDKVLRTAFSKEGLHERRHLDTLRKWLKLKVDEIPWCARFVNQVLKDNGIKGTGSNLARSFLKWGVPTKKPKMGDIVVFKRGNSSWQGHVAFFLKERSNTIEVIGGNQSDMVNIAQYSKHKLLGYRTYE